MRMLTCLVAVVLVLVMILGDRSASRASDCGPTTDEYMSGFALRNLTPADVIPANGHLLYAIPRTMGGLRLGSARAPEVLSQFDKGTVYTRAFRRRMRRGHVVVIPRAPDGSMHGAGRSHLTRYATHFVVDLSWDDDDGGVVAPVIAFRSDVGMRWLRFRHTTRTRERDLRAPRWDGPRRVRVLTVNACIGSFTEAHLDVHPMTDESSVSGARFEIRDLRRGWESPIEIIAAVDDEGRALSRVVVGGSYSTLFGPYGLLSIPTEGFGIRAVDSAGNASDEYVIRYPAATRHAVLTREGASDADFDEGSFGRFDDPNTTSRRP